MTASTWALLWFPRYEFERLSKGLIFSKFRLGLVITLLCTTRMLSHWCLSPSCSSCPLCCRWPLWGSWWRRWRRAGEGGGSAERWRKILGIPLSLTNYITWLFLSELHQNSDKTIMFFDRWQWINKHIMIQFVTFVAYIANDRFIHVYYWIIVSLYIFGFFCISVIAVFLKEASATFSVIALPAFLKR